MEIGKKCEIERDLYTVLCLQKLVKARQYESKYRDLMGKFRVSCVNIDQFQ